MPEPQPFAEALSSSPQLFARLLPTVFFDKYLALDPPIRPSLRSPTQFRSCSINTSALPNTFGSAVVRMGECIAVCGITGYIVDSAEVGPSSLYTNVDIVGRTGPPQPELMSMSEWMYETALATKLFNPVQLRIQGTTQTLVLQAQIQLLSQMYSGEVAWAALLASLAVTRIPKAIPADEEETVTADFGTDPDIRFSRQESNKLELNYENLPWCVSFGVMEDTGLVLADLEGRVEDASVQGRITIVTSAGTNSLQNLCVSAGKSVISKDHIRQCISLAKQRAAELDSILKSEIYHANGNRW
ncbi:hypothetical protein V1517DRAFT_345169 [Lipomyces orientalis]|uniref:Uncharacterized protein n=1 Tax=Lipomyces orientalis TaxID=1233043 RepID=A0ACC3TSE1_9ASCO